MALDDLFAKQLEEANELAEELSCGGCNLEDFREAKGNLLDLLVEAINKIDDCFEGCSSDCQLMGSLVPVMRPMIVLSQMIGLGTVEDWLALDSALKPIYDIATKRRDEIEGDLN